MTGRRRTDTNFHFRPSLPAMPLSRLNDVSFLHCPKAVHIANKHVDGNTHCSGTMTTGAREERKKKSPLQCCGRPVSLPAVLWQSSVFACSVVADQSLCLQCCGRPVSLPALSWQTSVFTSSAVSDQRHCLHCRGRPVSLPVGSGRPASLTAVLWQTSVSACTVVESQCLCL